MTDLPPPCEDLSAFIISGRVRGKLHEEPEHETAVRTPAQGVQDGIDAEALGFRRAILAERFDLKDSGVILGGIAARTSQLGLATGLIGAGSRHPLYMAGLGGTMQAAYGERFVLGLGRGAPGFGPAGHMSFEAFSDYCTIIKRLWAGERFNYDGPAGSFGELALVDRWEGKPPDIWYGGFGLPKGAEAIANTPAIDGLLLPSILTPEGVARAAGFVRDACERAGRDPASVRVIAEVITTPNLSDAETRSLAHARAVTYLQPPAWGHAYEVLNGWDPAVFQALRDHKKFLRMRENMADDFHRVELEGPARLIPDEWMADSCAMGSVEQCVRKLKEFKAAGADELTTYGSTPMQNAALVKAWREDR